MSKNKALIITDGTKPIRSIALLIKDSLSNGYKVKICPAKKFIVTDLLPVDIFFIGSKRAKPKSFAGLEEFFAHINLASRRCGIFSFNEKSLNYLRGILTDSEANPGEPLLVSEDEIEKSTGKINKWIKNLL
ncbi:MAG: hypothetical protein LBQ93_06700 [Treponema sp.]|nr:hypothetical protein [Treponema sp.]